MDRTNGKIQQTSQVAEIKGLNRRQIKYKNSRHERAFQPTRRILKRHAGWTIDQGFDGEQMSSDEMIWKRNNWRFVELWRGILQGKVHE